jgi:hypothetical protein
VTIRRLIHRDIDRRERTFRGDLLNKLGIDQARKV